MRSCAASRRPRRRASAFGSGRAGSARPYGTPSRTPMRTSRTSSPRSRAARTEASARGVSADTPRAPASAGAPRQTTARSAAARIFRIRPPTARNRANSAISFNFRYLWRPMRAVFADCHVGRRPGDEGPFLDALETARRRGATAITLLGDIFHFFIAHPKFETPAIARFLDTVRRLSAAGVPVTYVEGNRDFFLRGSYVEKEFGEVCDEEIFEAGGVRFLATHGDLLNEKDLPYRFWRFLSKNPISRAAIGVVPKQAGNSLVWNVEARLYRC